LAGKQAEKMTPDSHRNGGHRGRHCQDEKRLSYGSYTVLLGKTILCTIEKKYQVARKIKL
jgi:hypothetical protein